MQTLNIIIKYTQFIVSFGFTLRLCGLVTVVSWSMLLYRSCSQNGRIKAFFTSRLELPSFCLYLRTKTALVRCLLTIAPHLMIQSAYCLHGRLRRDFASSSRLPPPGLSFTLSRFPLSLLCWGVHIVSIVSHKLFAKGTGFEPACMGLSHSHWLNHSPNPLCALP